MAQLPTPLVAMKPPSHPLTHHEILRWVEPFTRRGRQVDLAASDRIARRLLFKPVVHEPAAADTTLATPATALPAFSETLQIDSIDATRFRLTRNLAWPNGLVASLQAEGPQLGELLARIEAIPAARQLVVGPGYAIAQSHRLSAADIAANANADADADTVQARLVLTRGVARVGGLTLTLEPPTVRGMLADLTLVAPAGETIALPDDLLAVLGRDWSRLAELGEVGTRWRSSLRLRRGDIARSRDAEAKLAAAAAHLAQCLSEPPARFHERHAAARRWVYARRSVPLLTCILLVVAAASVPKLGLADNSPWRMLIFNAPPLLLILVFCLRELPRIVIPPWPRPATAAQWRTARTTGDACSATR